MTTKLSKGPQPDRGPGFGRVFLSFVFGLGALVLVGLGFHYANTKINGDGLADSSPAEPTVASQDSSELDSGGQFGFGLSGLGPATETLSGSDPSELELANLDSTSVSLDSPDPSRTETTESDGLASNASSQFEPGVPLSEPADFPTAERLYVSGAYGEAARHFGQWVDENPNHVWGHFMFGLSLWKSGELDASEQALLAALDLNPDHVKSLVNLSRVRIEKGDPRHALLPIERAVDLAPSHTDALRVHARVLHNLGNREEAEEAYLATLRVDGDDAWSLNNLGLLWIEAGEFTQAIAPLARAVENSDAACFHNNLGIALERSGYFRSAVEAYARAIDLDDGYDRAYQNRDRAEELVLTQSRPDPDLALLAAHFIPDSFPDESQSSPMDVEPVVALSESRSAEEEISTMYAKADPQVVRSDDVISDAEVKSVNATSGPIVKAAAVINAQSTEAEMAADASPASEGAALR